MTERLQQPKDFSITGFFQITRIKNLIVIIMTQFFSAIFLIENQGSKLQDINLYLIIISTVLIAAAGNIINDYYDVKIDLINKPGKVVVGTLLKRRAVMVAHTVFNFLGIGIGFWIDVRIGIINFLTAFLLWLYSNQLKRMPFLGNLLVASLTGLCVLIIGIYYREINIPIILYSSFAFTSNLVREIIKDIEDLQGDQKFGSKTLPIIFGVRKTKGIILSLNFFFLVYIIYLFITEAFPGPDIILYFFLVPVLILSGLLVQADKKQDFARLSTSLKWFMLIGIISMIMIEY